MLYPGGERIPSPSLQRCLGVLLFVTLLCLLSEPDSPSPAMFVNAQQGNRNRCLYLNQMNGVATAALGDGFQKFGTYFCADTAPLQYACHCDVALKCGEQVDPAGRNIGKCQCCRPWVWALIIVAAVSVFLLIVVCILYCLGVFSRPLVSGYPDPLPIAAQGPLSTAACPPDQPLPSQLFRYDNVANLVNYYSPEYQQRLQDEQIQQMQERADAQGSGPRRRRHEATVSPALRRLQRIGRTTPAVVPVGETLDTAEPLLPRASQSARKRRDYAFEPFADLDEHDEEAYDDAYGPRAEDLFHHHLYQAGVFTPREPFAAPDSHTPHRPQPSPPARRQEPPIGNASGGSTPAAAPANRSGRLPRWMRTSEGNGGSAPE